MKKTLLAAVICTMTAAVAAFGQTQSLSFDDLDGVADSGTYNPTDTFSFNVSLTYDGYDAFGLSFWLQVQDALAPGISITNVTYFADFPDPNDTEPDPAPFNFTDASDPGFMNTDRDLGATNGSTPGDELPPGTYLVATVEFTLSGAAPGTYTLQLTTLSPRASIVTDSNFGDNPLPQETYTITIVPEPSTFALFGLAAAGMGLVAYRRRALTV